MVLNNKPQMFTVYFPSNFFYQEIKDKWEPIIERMKLPYQSVADFMNAQIQSVTFPTFSIETSQQQRNQYEVAYPGGKELEVFMNKDLTITFKLAESYISYFILWDQLDLYLHYYDEYTDEVLENKKACWLEPIHLAFLSDAGIQLTKFVFQEITPTGMGELNLSYAATAATYNTFTFTCKYNRFEIM